MRRGRCHRRGQDGLRGGGKFHPIAGHDGPGLFARGRVGNGGAGRDGGRIVARHVGNDEGAQPCRQRSLRQPPALDGRELAAQHVHLVDGRAAGQQDAVERLLVGQRHAGSGQREQRRTATGNERHHQVIGLQALNGLQDAGGGLHAGLVRHRMRGLQHLDAAGRHRMSVAGHHHARDIHVRPGGIHSGRHDGRALARPHHHAASARLLGQMPPHGSGGVGTFHGGFKNAAQRSTRTFVVPGRVVAHGSSLLRKRSSTILHHHAHGDISPFTH